MRERLDTRRVILLRPRRRCGFLQAAVATSVVYRVPAGAPHAGPEWVSVSFFQPSFFSAHALSFSPHPSSLWAEKPMRYGFRGMDTPGVCMNTSKSARMSACGACELCCGICEYDVYVRACVCACVPVQ